MNCFFVVVGFFCYFIIILTYHANVLKLISVPIQDISPFLQNTIKQKAFLNMSESVIQFSPSNNNRLYACNGEGVVKLLHDLNEMREAQTQSQVNRDLEKKNYNNSVFKQQNPQTL